MKTRNLFLCLFFLLLILSSCSKKSDLSNTIPADAFYVVRINAKSMIKKSDYDIFQNPLIQQGINFGKPFMKDNQKKLLENFIKDANALGIDLKGEYYIFATDKEFGLVVKMLDAKKFNDNLKTISGEDNVLIDKDTYVLNSYKSAVVWNNDKLIFISRDLPYTTNSNDIDTIVPYAKNLLTQSENNSIASLKEYNTFLAEAKDVSAYYSISKLMKWAERNSKQDSLSNKVASTVFKEFDGISIAAYLSFDKGSIASTQKFLYDSDNTEQRFKSFVNQFVSPVEGEQFKYVPQDNVLLASASIKGKALENYLTSIKAFDLTNETSTDTIADKSRQILKCIDGDITFFISDINISNYTDKNSEEIEIVTNQLDTDSVTFDSYTIDRETEEISNRFNNLAVKMGVLAKVSDAKLVAKILDDQTKDPANMTQTLAPQIYKLTKDPYNIIYFGLKDDLFFATTLPEVYEAIVSGKSIDNPYIGEKHTDDLFFLNGDFNKFVSLILSSPEVANVNGIDKYIQFFNLIGKYQFSVKANTLVMSGNLSFSNQTQNSLKTICLAIDELTRVGLAGALGNFF